MINILEYKYGSNKGAAVNGQTFASPLGYQGMNVEYTTAAVTGEVVPAEASGEYTLEFGPVKGTVTVTSPAGAVTTATPVDGKVTIGSGSGEVPAGSTLAYFYDNESVPVQAPQIKLDIKSLPIETKARKLTAIWAFDALDAA